MSRQRLELGTYGAMIFVTARRGQAQARARYRDRVQPGSPSITPDSAVGALVTYWLEDTDLEGRISRTTEVRPEAVSACHAAKAPPVTDAVSRPSGAAGSGTIRPRA